MRNPQPEVNVESSRGISDAIFKIERWIPAKSMSLRRRGPAGMTQAGLAERLAFSAISYIYLIILVFRLPIQNSEEPNIIKSNNRNNSYI